MRSLKKIIAFALITITGCTDYTLHPQKQEVLVLEVSNIQGTPSELNFGHLDAGAGESKTQVLTITNIGNATLNLSGIRLDGPDAVYSVTALTRTSLEPDAATRVSVTYIPRTHESNSNSVIIDSDDPNDAQVEVPITGQSSAPVIQIDPIHYDFGVTYIGCHAETTVNIKNIGDSDLIISDIQYYVSYPPELSIEIDNATYGSFPWTLEAMEERLVIIYHEPWDLHEDSGFIEAYSNDPATPVAISNQEALGDYYAWASDFYEQEEVANADILFVIDNSCSMHSHQTNLKNNFASFIGVFAGSGVDYQLAFITTDNENFVDGAIIRSTDADPIGAVNTLIDSIGISGSGWEKGLQESYEATIPGADAGPGSTFLRNDARLVIIFVSDERDGSTTTSSMTYADYTAHFLSLKNLSDELSVNAVAGDYPSGCSSPWAQFGDGYYDVVTDLGGTFMSICATDYGLQMETLASDSILRSAFELSETPIEESIVVTVDGHVTTGWTYNATENAIYFDATAIPATESEIYIDYAVLEDCQP